MDQEEKLFDKIEDFLKGRLSATEQRVFEAEIATDSDLAEMVEIQRFELEGAEYLVEKDLRAKMKTWEVEAPITPPAKKSIPINWKLFLGITTVLALIAFVIFKVVSKEPSDAIRPQIDSEFRTNMPESESVPEKEETVIPPKKEIATTPVEPPVETAPKSEPKPKPQKNYLAMAQTNYQMPENLSDMTTREAGSSTEASPLDQGFQLFDDKKWKAAIAEFSKIKVEQNPDEFDVAQEYLAHAYFNAKDYKSAASLFQSIHDQGFVIGQEETEWYLLLSLLPDYSKNKKAIKDLVSKIFNQESPHEYLEKVKALKI